MDSLSIDRAVSVVLAGATLVAVGFLVEGRLNPRTSAKNFNRVEYVDGWQKTLQSSAVALSDTARTVRIAVFTDFECPYCKRMDSVLTDLEQKHPGRISRSVLHFPIPGHQFARKAAVSFECATAQGRATQMHHELYSEQASFGENPWIRIALKAGVADTNQFRICISVDSTNERISKGVAIAQKLSVNTTPTVLVNGFLFVPALPETIVAAVNAVLAGKSPKP